MMLARMWHTKYREYHARRRWTGWTGFRGANGAAWRQTSAQAQPIAHTIGVTNANAEVDGGALGGGGGALGASSIGSAS